MGKNQDSGGQGWGASFLSQTTEDVARAVVAAAATVRPRPSVVFSTKNQNSNSQLQKLHRQVTKVWKGCPFPGDGKKAAYNPEVLTSQKRQWTRLQLQALERKRQKEPTSLVENIVVVGLHPSTDVQAIEVSLSRKRALDKETEGSERLIDVLRHQHRGVSQPNLEPQAHLVERTPSMSELNEIMLGQEHLKRNDLSFVFRLKVAENATLYGCCMVVEELVQKPPGLMPTHGDVPLFHSSLSRFLVGVKNKTAEVRTKLPNVILVDVNKNQVRMSSVPQLPQQKELSSALGPYHAKLVAESYLAKKRPVHEWTDTQAQAAEGFLAVLRSYLESICTNLRAHTITNVQSNDDKLFVDTQLFSVHTDAVLSFYQKE